MVSKNRGKTGQTPPGLRPFEPGKSGNPGGRPKSATLSKAYRQNLEKPYPNDPTGRTYAEVIADKLVTKAAKGDLPAARELADRAEGRAAQSMRLDVNNVNQQFERMTTAEKLAYAETGELPAWFKTPDAPQIPDAFPGDEEGN